MSVSAEMDAGAAVEEDDGAPLAWATWVRVSTKCIKRDPDERAAVLAGEEIGAQEWSVADRYWNLVIAQRLVAGDPSLSERYAAACVRELAARKEATSGETPDQPKAAASAPEPAPAPPEMAPPEIAPRGVPAAAGELKPSFLLREEAALGSQAMTPPLASSPAPVLREVFAFGPKAPAPPPVSGPAPAPPAGKTPLDMGTAIGVIPGVPALPFAPSAPGGDAVERAKQHASEVQPAPAPAARPPIGETEAVDVGALARRVLAFGPPKPSEPNKPAESNNTYSAPAAGARPPAPAFPALTVEQYASLCVDLELAPHNAAEVLRRYGLTAEGKRTLDEGWARVFAEQPARRAAFEHAKATYRAWLTRGGR